MTDADDRVRCCWCRLYASTTIPLAVRDPTGKMSTVTHSTRACSRGLGYDGLILRRCAEYRPIPPQYRQALPSGYRQGWSA